MFIRRALTECYPLQGYQIYLLSHSVCFICNTVLRTNKLEVMKLDLQINTDSTRVHVITGPKRTVVAFQRGTDQSMADLSKLLFHLLLLLGLMASSVGGVSIHGGEEAVEGEFPYIISIRRIANAFQHM